MKKKNAIGPKEARLLRKVARHILAEPRRYDQCEILLSRTPGEPFFYTNIGQFKTPRCGTIGCLAGWVAALSLGTEKALTVDPIEFAAEKLGLTSYQRDSLFGSQASWPTQFFSRYENARTPKAVARVASDRIEHFIKTGE